MRGTQLSVCRHFGQVTLGYQLLRTGFLTRSIRNQCETAFGSAVYGLRQGLVLICRLLGSDRLLSPAAGAYGPRRELAPWSISSTVAMVLDQVSLFHTKP
jgi:hypothetical protein